MKPTVAIQCPQCQKYSLAPLSDKSPIICSNCSKKWGEFSTKELAFERCGLCGGNQFYIQKDFNQAVGCGIMLIGIFFVPVTYGLSMVVCALVDWWFYHQVPTMVVCYKCAADYRGIPPLPHFKVFMHHIGVRYDKK